jgi:hypothetical protein
MRATLLDSNRTVALVVLVVTLLLPFPAFAQRVALVIGNAAYADRPLRNPVNDAQLMQAALRDSVARARWAEGALVYSPPATPST